MSALPPFTVLWGAQAAVHNPPGGPLKRSQAVRLSLPASYLGGGGGCRVPEPLWALPNQEPRCKTQPCFFPLFLYPSWEGNRRCPSSRVNHVPLLLSVSAPVNLQRSLTTDYTPPVSSRASLRGEEDQASIRGFTCGRLGQLAPSRPPPSFTLSQIQSSRMTLELQVSEPFEGSWLTPHMGWGNGALKGRNET